MTYEQDIYIVRTNMGADGYKWVCTGLHGYFGVQTDLVWQENITLIVKRKIKIFIIGLQENDPEIMPDPPVKYLQNNKYNQIYQVLIITSRCTNVHY